MSTAFKNVKQIKCLEAKLTKVRQDVEAPEHKERGYDSIFKGIHEPCHLWVLMPVYIL